MLPSNAIMLQWLLRVYDETLTTIELLFVLGISVNDSSE